MRFEICAVVGVDNDWQKIEQYDIAEILRPGQNRIFVQARNLAGPAGLLVDLSVALTDGFKANVVSDDSWQGSSQK